MDITPHSSARRQDLAIAGADLYAGRAPRPRSVAETGLGRDLLQTLLAKHLYETGVTDLRHLIERLRLAGPVLEEILQDLRAVALAEVRGVIEANTNSLRYAL